MLACDFEEIAVTVSNAGNESFFRCESILVATVLSFESITSAVLVKCESMLITAISVACESTVMSIKFSSVLLKDSHERTKKLPTPAGVNSI